MSGTTAGDRSPLGLLGVLGIQDVEIRPDLRHLEVYTVGGLVTLLWHGAFDAHDVVIACGGAMGGLLGPANGLYHDLGTALAARGIAMIRVGYRRPNDLDACVHDLAAVADLAWHRGGRRFVTMGHSFGGAVAIVSGIVLGAHTAGVVTLSTQSAGCEEASRLADTPLLLIHGERDERLPAETSFVVRELAGHGDVVLLPGAGHGLIEAADELRTRLIDWIPERFESRVDPQPRS
jgi:pimeloyl-ACP methyl ester carboxylesterase